MQVCVYVYIICILPTVRIVMVSHEILHRRITHANITNRLLIKWIYIWFIIKVKSICRHHFRLCLRCIQYHCISYQACLNAAIFLFYLLLFYYFLASKFCSLSCILLMLDFILAPPLDTCWAIFITILGVMNVGIIMCKIKVHSLFFYLNSRSS